MQTSGLLFKYKVNRPLTDDERASQFQQKESLDVDPIDQLSVIKVNSTYLEVVDKYYAMKGWFTQGMLLILTVILGILAWFYLLILDSKAQEWLNLLIMTLILSPIFIFCSWVLLKDALTYTHYPVRFNRKTRMVHVFMTDGRQLSVPWDKVFFYLAAGVSNEKGSWDIRGHILDEDGETVLDTFAMMRSDGTDEGRGYVVRQWEFIRRYMEDDHIAMIDLIQNCMPIDGKRETWSAAWNKLYSNIHGYGVPMSLTLLAMPMTVAHLPFRMIAMHTSKLPIWNKEIEAANVVEPDDPYTKDSSINPEGLR